MGGGVMIGNTQLVEYGIQTDMSDYRAHVGPLSGTVYIFKTEDGKSLVESKKFRTVDVYTGRIKTAVGHVVPVAMIPGISSVKIPEPWLRKIAFSDGDSTTEKGEKAVKIVKGLLLRGMFPILATSEVIDETDLQIKGFDIHVNLRFNIQVKCDYRCGIGPKCTGNLFLQIAECNPWRQI